MALSKCSRMALNSRSLSLENLRSFHYPFTIVLCLGLGFGTDWLAHGPRTVYATGFDETRFQQLRIGMSQAEVEAAVGQPLAKDPKRDDLFESTSDCVNRDYPF